jgi:hypothetical protein
MRSGGTLSWSAWVEAGWPVDKPKPAPEASFTMRYHVELVAPPPPARAPRRSPRAAAQDEAKFQAVAPDAPIAQWLAYTRYGTSESRLKTAIAHITTRDPVEAQVPLIFVVLSGRQLTTGSQNLRRW